MQITYNDATKVVLEELRKRTTFEDWRVNHGVSMIVGHPYRDEEIDMVAMKNATLEDVIKHIRDVAKEKDLDMSKTKLSYVDMDTLNVSVALEYDLDELMKRTEEWIAKEKAKLEQDAKTEITYQNERKIRRIQELQNMLDPEKQRILTIERDQLMKEVGHLLPQK